MNGMLFRMTAAGVVIISASVVIGCVAGVGYGVGYGVDVGYNPGYIESPGYEYGGWGGGYRVGPPRGSERHGGGRTVPRLSAGARFPPNALDPTCAVAHGSVRRVEQPSRAGISADDSFERRSVPAHQHAAKYSRRHCIRFLRNRL